MAFLQDPVSSCSDGGGGKDGKIKEEMYVVFWRFPTALPPLSFATDDDALKPGFLASPSKALTLDTILENAHLLRIPRDALYGRSPPTRLDRLCWRRASPFGQRLSSPSPLFSMPALPQPRQVDTVRHQLLLLRPLCFDGGLQAMISWTTQASTSCEARRKQEFNTLVNPTTNHRLTEIWQREIAPNISAYSGALLHQLRQMTCSPLRAG
ncbi:predicted protein [Uncinocarpus reesii 1704]|uniref:Uncharacterized protein n=1 Tax=Uncinocarpus reesii (strain UAMH 1704) TaxID=336963 RepID=C4JVZ7_UNCRE|nr:uncharacterized protein UREG_06739 [Uncinocarpus reesii 1704]EEP81874.1 predicted protein [Uncinocarpus reesii 1704]